jgi:histidine triad (HIT) family protein
MANYKATTEKGACVFCKIISGDITTPGIFWENDEYMAFLSTWPNTEGFSVVVPKKHYSSDVLEMSDATLGAFIVAAKTVSQILKKHFDTVGRVGLIMEGTGVDHAHIKLFPMHGTKHLSRGNWRQHHSDNEKFFGRYEGYIASNEGPKADEVDIRKLGEELRKVHL